LRVNQAKKGTPVSPKEKEPFMESTSKLGGDKKTLRLRREGGGERKVQATNQHR